MADNRPQLSDYLQIGANIGILVGLLLVGLQIREANRATTAQLEFDAWYGSMVSHEIMMGEDLADSWTKAQMNSSAMTARDLVVINAMLQREWLQNARMSQVAGFGFDIQSHQLTVDKWVYGMLANETALFWWRVRGQHQSTIDANPELHKAINKALDKLGDEHKNWHMNSIKQLLAGEKSLPEPGVDALEPVAQ